MLGDREKKAAEEVGKAQEKAAEEVRTQHSQARGVSGIFQKVQGQSRKGTSSILRSVLQRARALLHALSMYKDEENSDMTFLLRSR